MATKSVRTSTVSKAVAEAEQALEKYRPTNNKKGRNQGAGGEAESVWGDLVVQLSVHQERQLDELAELLSLSVKTILNSATVYAIFASSRARRNIDALAPLARRGGPKQISAPLSGTTHSRLRDVGGDAAAGRYARAGIALLHRKLVGDRTRSKK